MVKRHRLLPLLALGAVMGAIALSPNRPVQAQTAPAPFNAVCIWIDAQGNALDTSRLCGSSQASQAVARPQSAPARPATTRAIAPAPGSVPDYGVIFLSAVDEAPIHLGDRSHYLANTLGNASSGAVSDLRVYYDILVSIGDEYAPIAKGSKLIGDGRVAAGDRAPLVLSRVDVMDQVPVEFRATEDISIQMQAIGWIDAEGNRDSFAPSSYKLARGIGQCYFPWERDGAGRSCRGQAVSERL